MSRVRLDAATAAALRVAGPETELVGPDGEVVGVFVPPVAPDDPLVIDEMLSAEELAAIEALDTGEPIPHEEVVKRLGLE